MEKKAQESIAAETLGEISHFFFNVNCIRREQNVTEITIEEIRLRMVKDIKA